MSSDERSRAGAHRSAERPEPYRWDDPVNPGRRCPARAGRSPGVSAAARRTPELGVLVNRGGHGTLRPTERHTGRATDLDSLIGG